MKKIIALSSKIGGGKDTFAEIFAEMCDFPVEKHCFADHVRTITESLVGYKMTLTHEKNKPFYNEIYNYTQKDKNIYLPNWDKILGECLQIVGNGLRETFDKEVWVKSLFQKYDNMEDNHILIISDCRYINEADEILNRGGIVIRIEGDPMNIRKNSKRDLNHISETELDNYEKFTKIIKNDKPDINILRDNIKKIIDEYFSK